MTSFLSTIIKKPSFSRGSSGGKVDMTTTTVTAHALPSGPPAGKTTKTTTTTTTKALPLLTLNTDPNALTKVQSSASSAWSPQSAIEPPSAVSYTGSATPTITAATTHTPSSRPRADGSSSSKPEITTQRFMPLEFNVYSAPSKRPFSSSTGSSSSPATSSPIVAKLASANPFSSSSSSSAIPATPSTPTTTRVPEPTHHIGPHRKDRLFGITEAHNSLRLGPGQAFLTLHDGLRGSDPPLGTVVNAYSVVAAEEKARVDRERAKAQKKQDRKDLKGMSKEDKALDKERVKGEKERKKQEKRDAVDALELERSRTAETTVSHGGSSGGGGEEVLGTGFWDAFAISVMAYDGDVSGLFVTETLRAVQVGTKFEPRAVLRFSMDAASAYAPDSSELTRGRQRRKGSSGSGGSNEQGATEAEGAVVVALPRQEFEWYEAFTPVPGPGYEPQSEGWKLARLVSLSNGSKKRGEPLAVCVPNSRSRNKALRFEFVGKGKIAGKYGVSWELMAIMTGLAVCHRLAEISGSVG